MGIPELCRLFGYSKQSYYKRSGSAVQPCEREHVRSLVMGIRSRLPGTGGRKLYHLLGDELKMGGRPMGRDKLFTFLREEYLLVPKRKRYHRTTDSRHWMKKYPNLAKDMTVERPEQLWVADITYLRCGQGHHYLHLVTDAYSKKIVGYKLADNLQAGSTLSALRMALGARVYGDQLIHHSDRGLQYCSREYVELLTANGVRVSMTEKYDPYENAVAERVNGILKNEFGLGDDFESAAIMKKNVDQAIALYNRLRPHLSVAMLTPEMAHAQSKVVLRRWGKKEPIP